MLSESLGYEDIYKNELNNRNALSVAQIDLKTSLQISMCKKLLKFSLTCAGTLKIILRNFRINEWMLSFIFSFHLGSHVRYFYSPWDHVRQAVPFAVQ